MMDDKQRMAEMEAFIRNIVNAPRYGMPNETALREMARAILAPSQDPDAGAKEAQHAWSVAMPAGSRLRVEWKDYLPPGHDGWRAVAAWSDARVKAARIAALVEARNTFIENKYSIKSVELLILNAEAPDA